MGRLKQLAFDDLVQQDMQPRVDSADQEALRQIISPVPQKMELWVVQQGETFGFFFKGQFSAPPAQFI